MRIITETHYEVIDGTIQESHCRVYIFKLFGKEFIIRVFVE